ncbi:MAG: hypothetical protein ABI649_02235 [Gaiellaceae bacterium]
MDRLRTLSSEDPVAGLLAVGIGLAVIAVGGQTAIDLVNAFAFDNRYDPLNVDVEGNAFTWASASATFAAAFASLVHGVVLAVSRRRYLALASLLAFLSLDEVAQIHERIGWRVQRGFDLPDEIGARAFIFVYLPLLAVVALLLWRVASEAEARVRRSLWAGLALLGAAVVLEPLGAYWKFDSSPDRVEAAFEEALELGGWILVASGLTAVLYTALASAGTAPPRSTP